MTTLLEKAKSLKYRTKSKMEVNDETIELAMAWLNEEISFKQISFALNQNTNSGNVLYKIATIIREGYKKGKLEIKLVK